MSRLLGLALTAALTFAAAPSPAQASAFGDALASVDALAVDTTRSRPVQGFSFERGDVRYSFDEGTLYPVVSLGGQEVGAVFVGDGAFSYTPEHPFLKLRLSRWTWFKDTLEKGFDEGLILYSGASPLPAGSWGGEGPDATKAAAVFEARWQLLNAWPELPDNRAYFAHGRGPNLALDLAEDRLDPVPGPGVRFIEVNARPGRLGFDRTPPVWATPQRWWMSWYESPRGVSPMVRVQPRGALFTHGQTRLGYAREVFYVTDPVGAAAPGAVDVLTADHDVRVNFEARDERLQIKQTIQVQLEAEGAVARLLLVPREPRTWGSGRTYLEPYMRVLEVKTSSGAALAFSQRGGEVLFELPASFDGHLELSIEGDTAMGAGAQAESGLVHLWTPVGGNFDRVAHTVHISEVSGLKGLIAVASEPELEAPGVMPGSYEPPGVLVGRYIAVEIPGSETAPVTAYAYASQILGRFSGPELGKLIGNDTHQVLGFLTHALGPLPTAHLAAVQVEQRPAGMSYDPAAPGMNTFMSSAILAGATGIESMGNATVASATNMDSRNATGADLTTTGSNQAIGLSAMAIQGQAMSRQWWGMALPLADEVADYWLFEGLRVFIANWGVEVLKRGHPALEQYLNTWMRWAKRADQPGRQLLLGGDNGWLIYNRGAEARGYLLFNNLRYAVGEDRMRLGLRATWEALRGEVVTAEAFTDALTAAFGSDLAPLLKADVSSARLEGSLDVTYQIVETEEGTRLTAQVTGSPDVGATLGAAVKVTFFDMRTGTAFVPLDGGFDATFDTRVRKIEPLERGSGLVKKVNVTRTDG